MRSSTGQVLFAVPPQLSDFRIEEDRQRFTRLVNEKLVSLDDYSHHQTTMTSGGVRDWLVDTSTGAKDCALKLLSTCFGKQIDLCGACPYCRFIPMKQVQDDVLFRLERERKDGQATERTLRKLSLICLVCKRSECRGIPLLKGKGSKFLPENRGCCFSWKNCYQCGVSDHDRKTQCFDKAYMNNIACCECWVFKNVPGSKRHDTMNCEVQGRLRRLLSHHYLTTGNTGTFQQYIESIYTSTETFCQFLASIESKYISK